MAEAILVEAGVEHVVYVDRTIRAYAAREIRGNKRRYIVIQRPTTVKRLLTLAHEAAHVYFRHRNSLPSHRKEYEAVNYSFATLRRYGIPFDEQEQIAKGQAYVAWKMEMGRGTAKRICRECFEWSRTHLKKRRAGKDVLARVRRGGIELVDLGRPDPTLPPKPRKRTLEITFYEPGTAWRKKVPLSRSGIKGYTNGYAPSWTPQLDPSPGHHSVTTEQEKRSFTEILRSAISDNGESVNAIAKNTGIPQPVLARFYNGTRENLRLDVANTLATYLGYSLRPTS